MKNGLSELRRGRGKCKLAFEYWHTKPEKLVIAYSRLGFIVCCCTLVLDCLLYFARLYVLVRVHTLLPFVLFLTDYTFFLIVTNKNKMELCPFSFHTNLINF